MEQKTRITVAFISSRGLDPEEMEEDEDEEEDDDDDDFDFSTAGIKSKLPGKRIVEMKVITTNGRRKYERNYMEGFGVGQNIPCEVQIALDMAVDEGEEHSCFNLNQTSTILQATIELRYPMNSGANSAGNQLIQGKFKVTNSVPIGPN